MVTPEQVFQGLVSRGVPPIAALGMVGNLAVESNLNPGINEIAPLVPGSRGGYGLAQWTGPRRRQLEAWAAERGVPVSDVNAQLDFLAWELGNTERSAAEAIYGARTPEEAARLVSERFLRPGIPHLDRRISETQQLAGLLNGAGGQSASPPQIPSAAPQMPPMPQNALAQQMPAPPQMRNSLSVEPFLTQRRQNYLAPIPGSPFGA